MKIHLKPLCDHCREESEQIYRFLQGGDELMFCKDCWERYPPLAGPQEVLKYGLDLTTLPGVGLTLARRICQRWWQGDERKRMLASDGNPYALTDLPGIGFKKADVIALHLGVPKDAPIRAEAATVYVLEEAAGDGHTWLPLREVEDRVDKFKLKPALLQDALRVFEHSDPHVETRVTLDRLYRAEAYVADKLVKMAQPIPWTAEINFGPLREDQSPALCDILNHQVHVLLGAAGTGKTTLIKTLLQNLMARGGWHVALAAPTGKAARRLADATEHEAKTIHRLLKAAPDGNGGFYFTHGEKLPLEENFIIIDEASMIDVRLMQSFMKAVTTETRLLFVGDPWQLPSVGPGDVLRDMARSDRVPHSTLTILKRQNPAELLAANCQRVRDGEMVEINNDAPDFFFADIARSEDIIRETVSLMADRIPKRFALRVQDIQVLAALRERGEVSCAVLNQALRARLNPQARGSEFEPGDRVIQTQNDYELGVMNGDLGVVLGIHEWRKNYIVQFDNGNLLEVPKYRKSLEFAWALTVHKSQGSEWPVVIIPIHKSNGMLVARRRWFYTALSRGKRATIVLGDRNELAKVIERIQDISRFTWLQNFLEKSETGNSSTGRPAGEEAPEFP